MTESEKCGICFDSIDDTNPRGVLSSCPHVFCEHCILAWSNDSNVCPHCRQRFTSIIVYATTEEATRAVQAGANKKVAPKKPGGKKTNISSGNNDTGNILRQHKIKKKNLSIDTSDDDDLEEGFGVAMLPPEGLICSVCKKAATQMASVVLCDRRGCEFRAHIGCVGLLEVPGLQGQAWFCDKHRAGVAAGGGLNADDASAATMSNSAKKFPPKVAAKRIAPASASSVARQLDFSSMSLLLDDQILDHIVANKEATNSESTKKRGNIPAPSNSAAAAASALLTLDGDSDDDEDVPLFQRFSQQQQQQKEKHKQQTSRDVSTTSTQLRGNKQNSSTARAMISESPAPATPAHVQTPSSQKLSDRGWLCDYSSIPVPTPLTNNNNNNDRKNTAPASSASGAGGAPLQAHILDSTFTRSQIMNNSSRFDVPSAAFANNNNNNNRRSADDDDDDNDDPFAMPGQRAAPKRAAGVNSVGGKFAGALRQMRAYDAAPHPLDSIRLPDPSTYGGADSQALIQQQATRGAAELQLRKESAQRVNLMRRAVVEQQLQMRSNTNNNGDNNAVLSGNRSLVAQRGFGFGGDALRQLPPVTSMADASRRQVAADAGVVNPRLFVNNTHAAATAGAAIRAQDALARGEISVQEALDRAGGPMSMKAMERALTDMPASSGGVVAGRLPPTRRDRGDAGGGGAIASERNAVDILRKQQQEHNWNNQTNRLHHQQREEYQLLNSQTEAQLRATYFKTYLRSHLATLNTSTAARAMSEKEEHHAYEVAKQRAEADMQRLIGRVARERQVECEKMKARRAQQQEAAFQQLTNMIAARRHEKELSKSTRMNNDDDDDDAGGGNTASVKREVKREADSPSPRRK